MVAGEPGDLPCLQVFPKAQGHQVEDDVELMMMMKEMKLGMYRKEVLATQDQDRRFLDLSNREIRQAQVRPRPV